MRVSSLTFVDSKKTDLHALEKQTNINCVIVFPKYNIYEHMHGKYVVFSKWLTFIIIHIYLPLIYIQFEWSTWWPNKMMPAQFNHNIMNIVFKKGYTYMLFYLKPSIQHDTHIKACYFQCNVFLSRKSLIIGVNRSIHLSCLLAGTQTQSDFSPLARSVPITSLTWACITRGRPLWSSLLIESTAH